jgi:hypothetical protein
MDTADFCGSIKRKCSEQVFREPMLPACHSVTLKTSKSYDSNLADEYHEVSMQNRCNKADSAYLIGLLTAHLQSKPLDLFQFIE